MKTMSLGNIGIFEYRESQILCTQNGRQVNVWCVVNTYQLKLRAIALPIKRGSVARYIALNTKRISSPQNKQQPCLKILVGHGRKIDLN